MGTYVKTKINTYINLNKKLAIDLQTDRNIYPYSDIRKQNKTWEFMQNSQQVAGSIHYSPLLTALLTALTALTARVYLMTKLLR